MRRISYITGGERRTLAAAVIVAVAAVAAAVYAGLRLDGSPEAAADSLATAPAQRFRAYRKDHPYTYYNTELRQTELLTFDPNTADSTLLLRLGLQPWQVRNIYKYRANGGVFSRKSDFARVYGLTAGQYRRLEPYISIGAEYLPAGEVITGTEQQVRIRDTVRYPLKLSEGEQVALNTADTTLLKRIPGVGSYFARRIVSLRERLGGFHSVEQLKEIEGFPLSSLSYFVTGGGQLRLININRATLSQLSRHPYIGFYQARTIVEHRRLHGRIKSFDELRVYRDFPPESIERLRPYIEF